MEHKYFKNEIATVEYLLQLRRNGQRPNYKTEEYDKAVGIVEMLDWDLEYDTEDWIKKEAREDAQYLKTLIEEFNPTWKCPAPALIVYCKFDYFICLEIIEDFYNYFLIEAPNHKELKKLAWIVGEGKQFNNLQHRKNYLAKCFKNILIANDKYDDETFNKYVRGSYY